MAACRHCIGLSSRAGLQRPFAAQGALGPTAQEGLEEQQPPSSTGLLRGAPHSPRLPGQRGRAASQPPAWGTSSRGQGHPAAAATGADAGNATTRANGGPRATGATTGAAHGSTPGAGVATAAGHATNPAVHGPSIRTTSLVEPAATVPGCAVHGRSASVFCHKPFPANAVDSTGDATRYVASPRDHAAHVAASTVFGVPQAAGPVCRPD